MVAPQYGIDDYQNVDVTGKVVLFKTGTPSAFDPIDRAVYGSRSTKVQTAAEKGAVAVIAFPASSLEKVFPWTEMVHYLGEPRLAWLTPQGEPHVTAKGIRFEAVLNRTFVENMLRQEGASLENLEERLDDNENVSFAMTSTVSIQYISRQNEVDCKNVVGVLEGSDSSLKQEYVVMSAIWTTSGSAKPLRAIRYTTALLIMLQAPPACYCWPRRWPRFRKGQNVPLSSCF